MVAVVCDKDIDQLWADIIVIRIEHVDLIDKIPLFEPKHTARICKIECAIVVVEVPERGELELASTHDNRRAVRSCRSGGEQRARDGEHAAVCEDRVGPDDDFVDTGHYGVNR